MSQVKISGSGTVGTWSVPIRLSGLNGKDGVDGTDIEFVYKQTTSPNSPEKPKTSQVIDYIPAGWTDNPQGVSSIYLYEWICVRYKIAGIWGEFSSPVVWSKWGEKGMDGDGYEYIYKRTTTSTSPSRPTDISQSDDFIPTGWTDDPTGVSATYIYEWVCVRKKTNGMWGGFSSPAIWAKFGQDGDDGTDGGYFEYRYAKNGSNTTPPILSNTSASPNGWSTIMPGLNSLEYLWCTVAKKTASGELLQNWSTPVRINGVDGGKGDVGEKGESPATVFRGVYNVSSTYYGTKYRLDVVKYNGVYYVARIDAGTFSGKSPTDTSKWNTFGAQFESVATDLLLAENANIAGWVFRNNRLESQDGNIFLDGVNGLISIGNGKVLLKQDGSGKLANENISWDSYGNLILAGNLYASRGFRLGIKNVSSNATLTSNDCFVKTLGSTTVIFLPSSPYVGQLLYFVSQNGSSISINGNGKKIYSGMNGSSVISLDPGGMLQLVYVGGEWYVLSRNS